MRIDISSGLDLTIGPAPGAELAGRKSSSDAAILGRDYPALRFEVLVEQGDRIRAGEPVARDRGRPEILFVAPASGTVAALHRGARRALVSLRIERDGEESGVALDTPAAPDRDDVRRLMLSSGLWTALRARPFGHIPDPRAEPRALLVTATDTEPLAPSPTAIIGRHVENFATGMRTLAALCEAPLYLCQAPDVDLPIGEAKRVTAVEFNGPHPAGLPGTHIHALSPIGFDNAEVWHIGYQDVISLGHLMTTGRVWLSREVALVGPGVKHPRVLTVPVGAGIADLVAGELAEGAVRLISGSALSGHAAFGAEAYLGQRHNLITALPEAKPGHRFRWIRSVFDTQMGGEPGPLIPTTDFERVAPPGILPVPLLRALLVGDAARARELGALELVEEDLALLGYVCPSKTDYGTLLRDVLDRLHREVA